MKKIKGRVHRFHNNL